MSSIHAMPPIILASDDRYAMPLATTLRSIVEAGRSHAPFEFHVFSDGISEKNRRKILDSLPKGSATIRWIEADLKPFRKFTTLAHISKITFARFLIPDVFPKTVSKVLYLDADILVLDDIAPLCNTELDGALLGAVTDMLDHGLQRGELQFARVPRVGRYFNAGVLLIDLDRWREEGIAAKALDYLATHSDTPYSDQDALNVACDGRWKNLDPRWNFHSLVEKKLAALPAAQRPGIVHFVTRSKPWNARIPNLNADFYDAFRSRTRFKRTPWVRLLDRYWACWYRLKCALRRIGLVNAIWRRTVDSGRTIL